MAANEPLEWQTAQDSVIRGGLGAIEDSAILDHMSHNHLVC